VIPRIPNLHIDTGDFNDPWHAHTSATGKSRASRWHDLQLDSSADYNQAQDMGTNKVQEHDEHDLYDNTNGFGAADGYGDNYLYEGGADDLPFHPPSSSFNPQGCHMPLNPAQQPTSHSHSRSHSHSHSCFPSVALSTHHLATQQP